MIFDFNKITVGAIVAELPESAKVFNKFNIDFCCGGNRLMADVIKEQGIDEIKLKELLIKAEEERKDGVKGREFKDLAHDKLTVYIEDTHHEYLRDNLPKIHELLIKILRVHGSNHRELFQIFSLFGGLKTYLEQHLIKEEIFLFPSFENERANKSEIFPLSAEIIREHERAGEILENLRRLTNGYNAPEDACKSFRLAYDMLKELEEDLHQHIHLENNILLKDYDTRLLKGVF